MLAGWRSGSGRKVLLLHGGPGLSEYMNGAAEELAAGYEVFRYQQRGLSPSTTSGPFAVEDHLADALAVMNSIGPDPILVLGHSWGGYLAMFLIVRHPQRVAGALIVDPLGAVGDGGEADLPANIATRIPAPDLERADELDERAMRGEGTPEEAIESLRLMWPGYFSDPPNAPPMPDMTMSVACYSQTFDSIHAHQEAGTLESRLPHVKLPVRFLLGAGSPIPPRHGEATAALIPGAAVEVLDGCGHIPWLEKPGVVRSALDALAGSAPGAGAVDPADRDRPGADGGQIDDQVRRL